MPTVNTRIFAMDLPTIKPIDKFSIMQHIKESGESQVTLSFFFTSLSVS